MKVFFDELRRELDEFWEWQGLTSEEYISGVKYLRCEEFYYPRWINLTQYAEKAIGILRRGERSPILINLILEIMAIDNEDETVMENCEQLLETEYLKDLSEAALRFPMYEARWQIAELLGRNNNDNCKRFLIDFVQDEHKYVQRRALISLSRIYPEKAEEISIEKLTDPDDYLRLVSIRILKDLDSKYLPMSVKLLENDTFSYVKQEVELIKEDILNLGDV
ncbi:MAG: HEAT repeat domain-containing protein [Bacillota bacterium]|nr:HEAT repeat domain-containing protein [Bacillota bacterium]